MFDEITYFPLIFNDIIDKYTLQLFLDMVSSQINNVRPGEIDEWVESLVEALQKQSLSSNLLDLNSIRSALKG
jgi:hypothetical protein